MQTLRVAIRVTRVTTRGRAWCSSGGSTQDDDTRYKMNGFMEREGSSVFMVERVLMDGEGKIVTLMGLPYLGTDEYWNSVREGMGRFDGVAVGEPLGNTQGRSLPPVRNGVPNFIEEFPAKEITVLHTKQPSPLRLLFNRDKYLAELAQEAAKTYVDEVHAKPYPHTGLLYDPALLPIFKEKLVSKGFKEYSNSRVYFGCLTSSSNVERSIVSVQFMRCMLNPPKPAFRLAPLLLLSGICVYLTYYLFLSPDPTPAPPPLAAGGYYFASSPPTPYHTYQHSYPAPAPAPAPRPTEA
eukprot:TRINITY_DN16222_c0_g1_i1.p1 TRINITY_DN16222_c0_g1~~TRINITY_DN16222_c0_g1_i1.p1  ORF type:complete len:307 (+),score=58.33 TRINITY_DN16222_c0_g1_i1:35-922(+)